MIERLLAAERALTEGQLDHAERLFRQVVDADERNAIAVVGLAEVALARGDRAGAETLAARALVIDPDDTAAARLLAPATGREAPEQEPVEAARVGGARASLAGRLRAWLARLVGRPG